MTSWVIPCNEKYYNHREAFANLEYIDWRQSTNVEIGDEVYIYVGQSVGAILYKCNVINVDMNTCSDNDMEYNINGQLSTVGRYMRLKLVQSFEDGKFPRKALLENGLKTVQGPTKATEQLIAYLEQ
ncbi:MAG: hypothetical protein MSK40_15920 [Parabacteroides sp.]|nr:hypothetical protein [Parabacteroides sp.]MDY4602292.1 hypothetical protein [Bacteroides uniformis]